MCTYGKVWRGAGPQTQGPPTHATAFYSLWGVHVRVRGPTAGSQWKPQLEESQPHKVEPTEKLLCRRSRGLSHCTLGGTNVDSMLNSMLSSSPA